MNNKNLSPIVSEETEIIVLFIKIYTYIVNKKSDHDADNEILQSEKQYIREQIDPKIPQIVNAVYKLPKNEIEKKMFSLIYENIQSILEKRKKELIKKKSKRRKCKTTKLIANVLEENPNKFPRKTEDKVTSSTNRRSHLVDFLLSIDWETDEIPDNI
jgi:hypothetical protein